MYRSTKPNLMAVHYASIKHWGYRPNLKMSRIYQEIADAISQYLAKNGSLKTIIFTKTSPSLSSRRGFMYLLALQTLRFQELIDSLFDRTLQTISKNNKLLSTLPDNIVTVFERSNREPLLYLYTYGLSLFSFELFWIVIELEK